MIKEVRLLYTFIHDIFPEVDIRLEKWKKLAGTIPDPVLRHQALESIRLKRFHCLGGSVYALYPGTDRERMLDFIVAFQTISDYLDNLCDRAGCLEERAFRRLHQAYLDAVSTCEGNTCEKSTCKGNICKSDYIGDPDYYEFYPHKDDGGYLNRLVAECRRSVLYFKEYGRYGQYEGIILHLARLYTDLQTYKHIEENLRINRVVGWAKPLADAYGITPWEFAAAAGSTLGIFVLCAMSCCAMTGAGTEAHIDRGRAMAAASGIAASLICGNAGDATSEKGASSVFGKALAGVPEKTGSNEIIGRIVKAYFPWITGYHILLDYFIDYEEDMAYQDLNLASHYTSVEEKRERIALFAKRGLNMVQKLDDGWFHGMVIFGLTAMYLSDEKAEKIGEKEYVRRLLEEMGAGASVMWKLCRFFRKRGII